MEIRVYIPSNAFNVINFVLFDLLFAFLIHYLTATIAGLFNCLSVLSYSSEDFRLRNTPFVGPGITCTKPRVFMSLSLIRLLSWIFVFIATFFSTGKLARDIHKVPADVLTIGTISTNQLPHVLLDKAVTRRGCQGRASNFTFYGEIRNNKCELDLDLLENPIKFGFTYEHTDITLDECAEKNIFQEIYTCRKKKLGVLTVICRRHANESKDEECTTMGSLAISECTKNTKENATKSFSCLANNKIQILNECSLTYVWTTENHRCKNAVIGCYHMKEASQPICSGTVKMSNSIYICDELSQSKTPQRAMCKVASGIKWDADELLDSIGSMAIPNIDDALAIMYSSATERREVQVRKKGRLVTVIHPMWFAILSLKIITAVSLTAVGIYLRVRMRLKPLANDEHGMMKLLAAPKLRNPYGSLILDEVARETEVHVYWDGTSIKLRASDE